MDADVLSLIQVAEGLVSHRAGPKNYLSTSIIMFALSQAGSAWAPRSLAESVPARHFGHVLKEAAGALFAQAWNTYFGADERVIMASLTPASPKPSLTRNSLNWLKNAAKKAALSGRSTITVSDVIAAFWEIKDGGLTGVIRSMRVSMADMLDEYERRILTDLPILSAEDKPFDYLVHDHATNEDHMDFNQYAIAITSFLTSPDTHGPISISIQAPWGAGKSSLMHQVRHILDADREGSTEKKHATIWNVLSFLNRSGRDESAATTEKNRAAGAAEIGREKRWTVWFNAWKYESSEQVWAGLVDAIVSQVSERMSVADRELFLLRLNLARIDDGEVRKKIYDRLASYWWVGARWILLLGVSAVAGLFALLDEPAAIAKWSLGGLGSILSLWLLRAWNKVGDEPATFSLAEYVKVPDYGKSMGVVHQIHEDLQRIISVLPKRIPSRGGPAVTQPLVIFVDDLDRCSPNKVASIVEGINTFLASDQPEFMFVIGMDPQMVAAALEHAHQAVKLYLPSYEQGVPLGWRFMDKFIQLAFTIPPRRSHAIEGFLSALIKPVTKLDAVDAALLIADLVELAPDTPVAGVPDGPPSAEQATQLQQAVSKTVTNESEDVRTMMTGITQEFFCSPREIKRILNLVRFVLLLRVGRIARQEQVPALALYQRWVILCIRWPDMARWIQWGAGVPRVDEKMAGLDGMTARRLAILEGATVSTGEQLDAWTHSCARDMGLADKKVNWLSDPDLHRFFIKEANREASQRVSHGASVGFY